MKVENMEVVNSIVVLLMGVFVILMLGLTGCSGSTGWTISFGVAPIKAVDNRQQLSQETYRAPVKKEQY